METIKFNGEQIIPTLCLADGTIYVHLDIMHEYTLYTIENIDKLEDNSLDFEQFLKIINEKKRKKKAKNKKRTP